MSGTEIVFEVSEDEIDGGYSASALGYGIHTQADTLDELRRNVREAVECYFDDGMDRPRLIRLLPAGLSDTCHRPEPSSSFQLVCTPRVGIPETPTVRSTIVNS